MEQSMNMLKENSSFVSSSKT